MAYQVAKKSKELKSSYDYSGSFVSSAGDVDGDGLDDILIGAYGNDDGGSGSGLAITGTLNKGIWIPF